MKKAFPMRERRSQPSTLQATEGERSEPKGAARVLGPPDPEVPEKARCLLTARPPGGNQRE